MKGIRSKLVEYTKLTESGDRNGDRRETFPGIFTGTSPGKLVLLVVQLLLLPECSGGEDVPVKAGARSPIQTPDSRDLQLTIQRLWSFIE